MPVQPDAPAIARKREREERTVSQMIALYCRGHHEAAARTERAVCGEAICAACEELDAYASVRTRRCHRMAEKSSCDACPKPCYAPAMKERIRMVMRYAGPRMLLAHPVAALRHLVAKIAS